MTRRGGPTPDLFGEIPREGDPKAPVRLAMTVHRTGQKAWLLTARDDPDGRNGQWLPFSVASRGEGREADLFTMPRWIAADRGWL